MFIVCVQVATEMVFHKCTARPSQGIFSFLPLQTLLTPCLVHLSFLYDGSRLLRCLQRAGLALAGPQASVSKEVATCPPWVRTVPSGPGPAGFINCYVRAICHFDIFVWFLLKLEDYDLC